VAMSADSPDPSWQLPLPPDSGPERRRVKPVHLLLGSLLALALLCCGGAAAVEVFSGGKSDKSGAASIKGPAVPSDEPTTEAVTTTAAAPGATPSETPTPSSSPRKSSTPKPRPTTRKPTTEPTTRPPTKSPTPTTTPLPIVRPGTFCAPVGALGVTARGKLMRCTRLSEDDRPRWRAV